MTKGKDQYRRMISRAGARMLETIRNETGDSTTVFSLKIGLSDKGYRNYEKGERQLPQAKRLAIIDVTGKDPLPTEVLVAELKPETMDQTKLSFWEQQRGEFKARREENYTRLGQKVLCIRDWISQIASYYVLVENIAYIFDQPFGFEINGIDWLYVISFLSVPLLFMSLLPEMPLIKLALHLLDCEEKDRS